MEKDVPYIVYESEAARHERTVKRLEASWTGCSMQPVAEGPGAKAWSFCVGRNFHVKRI